MNIENYSDAINACRFCFMCRHLSAVGQAEGREADTPRVRALMAYDILRHPEKLADADFAQAIYRSDLSGANRYHCNGVHPDLGYDELGIQLALRRDIVESGHAPAAVMSLADELESTASWSVQGVGKVVYFVDNCTADMPDIVQAFKVLADKAGVEYRTISGGCIGKSLSILGYQDRARFVAAGFAEFVNNLDAETLVVSNPAAFDALTRDYSVWGLEIKPRVLHSSEFIAGLGLSFRPVGRVSYLESDFLKNYVPDYGGPSQLLSALGAERVMFGTNNEESYSAGEGAVVLQRLFPKTVKALASRVAEQAEDVPVVTASPFTRKVLSEAGMAISSLEELAAQQI